MNRAFVSCCILSLCVLCGFVPGVFAQPDPRNYLYQVSARDPQTGEERIGFIDNTGKIVIGYDRLPKTILRAGDFREGRALVYARTMKRYESTEYPSSIAGYIDQTGAVVVAPKFDVAHDFSEGLAYVELEAEGFKGFIDREGRRVIRFEGRQAKDFHQGLAAAQAGVNKKWGYIDRLGRWAVKPQYEFADDFSEGLAGVVSNGKYGFINQQGVMAIPTRFDVLRSGRHPEVLVSTGRFSEGLASVIFKGSYGYINRKGELIIPAKFWRAQEFSEGLAWVVTTDPKTLVANKAGWIDKSGRWIVTEVRNKVALSSFPQLVTYASDLLDWRYSEGLVPFFVYSGERTLWGYMDQKGHVVIEAKPYNRVGRFFGGVAWVEIRDFGMEQDYGYIDKQGRFIWRSG